MLETEKLCCKCKTSKPRALFTNDKRRADGKYPQCKACRAEWVSANREEVAARMKAYHRDNVPRALYNKAAYRAKKAGVPFTITVGDVVVPSHCPVLGIPLQVADKRFGQGSPSLDRLVPELGYVPGNVVVISFRANLLKNNATVLELEAVASWLRARQTP